MHIIHTCYDLGRGYKAWPHLVQRLKVRDLQKELDRGEASPSSVISGAQNESIYDTKIYTMLEPLIPVQLPESP
jgi:hypothetical protein